ncbi:hypothetical protein M0R19_04275 [Candidatus Pacearchaeota archaeon]|nr:hypothetical protein [Candidatus Pacearchaeota archaeon]
MAIEVRVGEEQKEQQEEEKLPEESLGVKVKLNIRKTLDGNLVVRDHPNIDIILDLREYKVIAIPKEDLNDQVYQIQDLLFQYLQKKGVIYPESVKGGNIYGAMEAKFPKKEEISGDEDPVQVIVFVIAKFIENERPKFEFLKRMKDEFEEWLTDPEDEETTELGKISQEEYKGTIPKYIPNRYTW